MLAINSDERSEVLGTYRLLDVDVGNTYDITVDRLGKRVSLELPLPLAPTNPFQSVILLYALAFFACGAGLAILRPEDAQVRLMGGTIMVVGASTLFDTVGAVRGFLVGWERVVCFAILCLSGWAFPMTYHSFARFPTWTSPGPLWTSLQWLLYAALVLVFWPSWLVSHMVSLALWAPAMDFFARRPSLFLTAASIAQRAFFLYIQVCLLLALLVTARNYRRLRDPGSRRRIRWVVAGLTAACVPWLALMFAFWAAGWISAATYRMLYPFVSITMLCVPASMVLAIWKDQLFDIRVLVRRGLQYLFARTALRLLLALPFAVLTFSILSNPNRTLVQILTEGSAWLNFVGIAAIGVTLRFRPRLQSALDRRFFREAYEQEQVLLQLIDEVRQADSIDGVARLVSDRINRVLHPTVLHVFYRAQERSRMIAGHSSSGSLMGHQLSEELVLLRTMDGVKVVRDYPADFTATLPESERCWLEELDVRLVVPITGSQDRLVGLLLLGERMSDEPYSATDRRLLQSIAAQIGLVYENQHLQSQVRSDAEVRRHVLARLDEQSVSLLKECPMCGRCYDSSATRCEHDGAEVTLTLPVERTLDGKYRLDRALGRGGMGAVYEATDLRLQRIVAAKLMMGALFGNQAALRRFEREARAAARIDHRNITRVHDYGTIGPGGAYLIMELLAGRTWRTELLRLGVIAPATAAAWFTQLLDGLHFAHEAGIVHRDLKPENVMVLQAADGLEELKIMDFGLAKVVDAGTGVTESVTIAGGAMGTLGYMAPEALAGSPVDARADVFAIGVMVVESLTGKRPFGGATPQEVITAILQTSYRLPGASDEVQALDAVVQRCLAKDPRDRYSSAATLATDLSAALARCPDFTPESGGKVSDAPTGGGKS